ncbi:hypothetical protein [Pseudorhodoplanes sinuspersici]|uniref:Uncharacterized protein n=1 Tax=Pseudorhodoplanes sinuspersici TaxID=1235591 RepID=A0A1W6ZSN2_9HYPH|nr:hypothetical protein [Pseudorhodoplanes sinuspersici]ARQ00397.1 hypothetical protein CAK95_15905 [Pseudorhodoplanes sinuspersici]RKE67438.1 hypothetical protein DFP91_5202 [Pseudorhodoplanes sinuspersici]
MLQMNYWTDKWDLHEDVCPCDVHVNEWIKDQGLKNKDIFHFGTGTHHVVGIEQARNGTNNAVMGITASIEEYDAYIKLVSTDSAIAKSYIAYFGDIYLTNPRLLPSFDIVTMVHLCEFFFPNTASPEYGGMTDRGVLDLFTDKTRSGGYLLFYTNSMGKERTAEILPVWEKEKPVERVADFKTLIVYRKK